jgi:phosphatidylserine/phosphatidylglycerophosphate/cardiolipin synthase-like enzyme
LQATRSIVIVGWDFDSCTDLHIDTPGVPALVGEFLNFLIRRRRSLEAHILIWDSPLMFSKGREPSPLYGLGWRPHRRVHFQYDRHCPLGASLHDKFVVIDAAVAFCGGIDLTRDRWDTPEHRAEDPRRVNPGQHEPYAPVHDAMMMVEGEGARALHDIASERWHRATGNYLPRATNIGVAVRGIKRAAGLRIANAWPESAPVAFRDVRIGIARTVPETAESAPVAQVQALYLDMIAAARHYIYLENQYFSSKVLGDALAARLTEPGGPEIMVVLRLSSAGWLEAPTMGTLRTQLLTKLRRVDRYGRFHAYYLHMPGLDEGQCCDLHTKLMIVDDQWLRLGSANFANRSMWLDTECDLVIEAVGNPPAKAAVAQVRNRLIAEHLNVAPQAVQRAFARTGSLSAAVRALARNDGRTLKPFEQLDEPSQSLIAASAVADPEKPASSGDHTEGHAPILHGSHASISPGTHANRVSYSARTSKAASLYIKLISALVRRLSRSATTRYDPGNS